MTDRNLNAYYYCFEPTGCDLVDAVLEQVARAGKAFHSTEDWSEEDTDGRSPAAKMQAAANASAQAILALIAENERLSEEHDKSWRRNQMLEENMRAVQQYVVRYTWFRKQVEHNCPNLFAVYQNIGHDWIQVTDLDREIDHAIAHEEP